jgi:hypothetical protein
MVNEKGHVVESYLTRFLSKFRAFFSTTDMMFCIVSVVSTGLLPPLLADGILNSNSSGNAPRMRSVEITVSSYARYKIVKENLPALLVWRERKGCSYVSESAPSLVTFQWRQEIPRLWS